LRKKRELELIRISEELLRSNQKLKEASLVDGLTGVPNRRYFNDTFILEWKRCSRSNTCLAAVMIDIDYFKLVNDTYGHQHGDQCLKQVAEKLSDQLHRPSDFLARYGGEEFVALLPDTDLKGATIVAENMRRSIEALAIEHISSKVMPIVTISAGVSAIHPLKDEPPDLILNQADSMLYKAKEKGRNQVQSKAVSDNCIGKDI